MLKRLKGTRSEKNLIDLYNGRINHLSQEFQKVNNNREKLYENYTEGILDADEYQFAKQSYDIKAEELSRQLNEARKKKDELESVLSDGGDWLTVMHSIEQETEVSQEMVNLLVDKICVYEERKVEVFLNFADEKRIFEQIIEELSRGE